MSPAVELIKFPRTPHLEGSTLQAGDGDLPRVGLNALPGDELFVSEKLDGVNVGLRFDASARPWLFSRAHFLGAEPWFDRLKQQIARDQAGLFERLGTRFVLYGEWLEARHTVFYDALPAWLFVFDLFDLEVGRFLGTAARRRHLAGLELVEPPELFHGPAAAMPPVPRLLAPSRYVSTAVVSNFEATVRGRGLSVEKERAQTQLSGQVEGLVFRVERDGWLRARCKYVRPGFRQTLAVSDVHWARRPFVPNLVAPRSR
ncbi:MAG: RNA ligase family protein [Myxococcaceae bacterium]|nr:RNA ligase family protein [Myxococcaceae bacterium]